jgi:glycosyltransferase involved in cell wall biosynthesis
VETILSVVIPVYNVEEYILDCLESLTADCAEDIEIVTVDDGSSDRSAELIKDFFLKKPQFRTKQLSQKNSGASVARNAGILAASGKYIMFADSDDIVMKGTVNRLIDLLRNSETDIVIGNAHAVLENSGMSTDSRPIDPEEFNGMNRDEALNCFIKNYECVIWRNLYKRTFILENKLFFQPNNAHEDVCWMPFVLNAARSFQCTDILWYCYRVREGSVTTSIYSKKDMDKVEAAEIMYRLAETVEHKNLQHKIFKNASRFYRLALKNTAKYGRQEAGKIVRKAQSHLHILKKPATFKNLSRYWTIRIIGLPLFTKIYAAVSGKK